ncbi:GNAT family N-acetyltransferase [Chlorogloeopsis fritschii PCC 9212]|uniref:GNAT family N-acetyltransferase n=1 Tax=Chlorogloeopsis fritschii TaxID=1124 RepID=UPI000370E1B6|nr:GNAT family N-acetyltransferase [Chlorogloeopsis fritschii]MBF2007802.1 GNAT family N-acetyltransferase [Chlorogloeopsis fritschii C42_A2020_084]
MLFETQHLTIHLYQNDDVDRLLAILSDPITMRYWPQPFTREGVEVWIARNLESYNQHGFGRYKVFLKETGELIGDAGILKSTLIGEPFNDLGYIIHNPFWGYGYGTEVAIALKDYAFTKLKLDSLYANMPWNHAASRRVAEKIGMKFVKQFANERNRNIQTLLYVTYNNLI